MIPTVHAAPRRSPAGRALPRTGALAVAVLLLAAASFAEASEVTVYGRVLDEEGRGVEGAEIASAWVADATGLRPLEGATVVRTGEGGRWSASVTWRSGPATFLVYDGERARGAVLTVDPSDRTREHDVALTRTTRVETEVSVEEGKFYPAGAVGWLAPLPRSECLVRVEPDKGRVAIPAPPGKHEFTVLAPGREGRRVEIDVAASKAPLSVAKIDLAKSDGLPPVGSLPPPIRYTEASGGLDSMLEGRHFPARWTLLYFWDHT